MHVSSGLPLSLSILVATIYCYCHTQTCRDKSSWAGRQRGRVSEGPLERWNLALICYIHPGMRDVTSSCLGFPVSKRRVVGESPSLQGAARITLEWEVSADSSAKRGLPAAKCS